MHAGAGHPGVDAVTDAIRAALAAAPQAAAGGICVGLSGGLDSSVLLHALAGMRPAGSLRAAYIDHGLHPDASAWGAHCAALCAALGVPYACHRVAVVPDGEGIEAAARRARYAALLGDLQPGETLVTAHHRDDQAETLLLNLLRGSGPAGLAGIAGRHPEARLLRPLLAVPRAAILGYARAAGLAWVEDPANRDPRFDRNFLRLQVLPLLASRWPASAGALARSAALCTEAAALLDDLAVADARRVTQRGRIVLDRLATLTEARQRNLLRHLCRIGTGTAPPGQRLRAGLGQLLQAGSDRQPLLAWPGGEIRRFRGHLHIQRPLGAPPVDCAQLPARAGASLELGAAAGRLSLRRARAGAPALRPSAGGFTVRFRQGGERLRPVGSTRRRDLKKLLQERGVVPWMRGRIPLLFADGQLVAVADLWIAQESAAAGGEPGLRICWDRHPPLD